MMRLGETVKRAQLLKIKVQVSSIWANGCILMTVCVFHLTCMTTPPWCRESVMVYYVIVNGLHVA